MRDKFLVLNSLEHVLKGWLGMHSRTLAKIFISKLVQLSFIKVLDNILEGVAFEFELLTQSAQIHVDPSFDLHVEEVLVS